MTLTLVQPSDQAEPKQQRSYKPDDDEIALELADELAGKAAYFHHKWHVYEHGVWTERNEAETRLYIRNNLRNWRGRGIRVTQALVSSVTAMLRDDLFISDREITKQQSEQRRYVNLRNGMLNLDTMDFEERHDANLYFTSQLDFDYDPEAKCPTFQQYLRSSLVHPDSTEPDKSLITLALQALAYSMTARTDLKSSFWLVGQKDSGKSTFISLLKDLMGSLHGTIDLTQLGTNRFLLSGIVGKRVVTFTEASGSSVLPDALYKALTGGSDEIYADVKNKDAISFRPEAKIWWAMNEKPRITDRSGATMRRIVIIPFNRTIPESERISDLEWRLHNERSGIFNKMVIYYQRLRASGLFEVCEQSEERRQEYIMENDTEATFIEECAEKHESYKTKGGELHQRYQNWCEINGFHSKNRNQVAGEWRRLGFAYSRSDGSWWHGLRLKKSE